MRQERDLKKLMKQRDLLPDEKNDNTSWSSLKKINYALKEEQKISKMIGIKYDKLPFIGKEGIGGGGKAHKRKQISLSNVGSSQ